MAPGALGLRAGARARALFLALSRRSCRGRPRWPALPAPWRAPVRLAEFGLVCVLLAARRKRARRLRPERLPLVGAGALVLAAVAAALLLLGGVAA